MRRESIHPLVFGVVALPGIAAAWWGCAEGSSEDDTTSGAGGSTLSLSAGSAGSGGSGGGATVGVGGSGGGEVCTATIEKAEVVPLDLIFVIDRSGSMAGEKWLGTTSALTTFFDDPASAGISAGLVYFPTVKPLGLCEETSYIVLDVPIDELPDNSFNLTNSMPAEATGWGTPTFAALKGALLAATAYQDKNPTHKVNVVLATDGDPYGCDGVTNNGIANLAESALGYNGVHTYVIGVEGSIIQNLDQIAEAGGTTAAYDITDDIDQFSAAIAEIRSAALGCEFAIPPPPQDMELVPNEVNFTYTPGGSDSPVTLPKADDLADCGDEPGWYYDDNFSPTKIILCPASCATVQNDSLAEVNVAFGCISILN